tara:strand:- start:291 stop:557 length:267 start_codon:yes stop_codon:yes gene_type:complete
MTVRKDRKVSVEKVLDNNKNTGDPMAQVSIFTDRINYLTEHLKMNKKDHSSRRGLVLLVEKRKKMLTYIKRRDFDAYQKLIEKLGIRK